MVGKDTRMRMKKEGSRKGQEEVGGEIMQVVNEGGREGHKLEIGKDKER